MANEFNFLRLLTTLTPKKITQDLPKAFQAIMSILDWTLKIKPSLKSVKNPINTKQITISVESEEFSSTIDDFFNFGVQRTIADETYSLMFFLNQQVFLPHILLREAYYCFVPQILRNNRAIKQFIIFIVYNNLNELPSTNDWRRLIHEKAIDQEYILTGMTGMEKSLVGKRQSEAHDPVPFFFYYINEHKYAISNDPDEFYNEFFKDFYEYIEDRNDENILETFRVTYEIQHQERIYNSLTEYHKLFNKFIRKGFISTSLSANEYKKNLRWISNFTLIGPNYTIDRDIIGIYSFVVILKFNQKISFLQVRQFLKFLPFLTSRRFCYGNYSICISLGFLVTSISEKDFLQLMGKIERFKYANVTIYKRAFPTRMRNILNLNYFREFYKNGKLLSPDHKSYDSKYVLDCSVQHDFKDFSSQPLSLLEYIIIIQRSWKWAPMGLSFRIKEETLDLIKKDIIDFTANETTTIMEMRDFSNKIATNPILNELLNTLLEDYKEYGFFYLKFFLNEIKLSFSIIEDYFITELKKIILELNIEIESKIRTKFDDFIPKNITSRKILKRFIMILSENIISIGDIKLLNKLMNDLKVDFSSLIKLDDILPKLEEYITRKFSLLLDKTKQSLTIGNIAKTSDEALILSNLEMKKFLIQRIIPIYKKDLEDINQFKDYFNVIFSFLDKLEYLGIFNLFSAQKIINNERIAHKIFTTRAQNLKKIREDFDSQSITVKQITDIIDKFTNLDPPVINPILLTTLRVYPFSKYTLNLRIKYTKNTWLALDVIKHYFPRVVPFLIKINNEVVIHCDIYIPEINSREKLILFSILLDLFRDNLLDIRRFISDGIAYHYPIRHFYNFINGSFTYTSDLFEQAFKSVRFLLGTIKKLSNRIDCKVNKSFRMELNDDQPHIFPYLIKKVDNRLFREKSKFLIKDLYDIQDFHLNLKDILINQEKLEQTNKKDFYSNFIGKIKFIPIFQLFGLGQYYVFLQPSNIDEIDLRLLLFDTFQSIRQSASIESHPSLLIKYIFPYKNPNTAYINWLISVKAIFEYTLFHITKINYIIHFNSNIVQDGWTLNPDDIKSHAHNIFFHTSNKEEAYEIKTINIGDIPIGDYIPPTSPLFSQLKEIYGRKSKSIKFLSNPKYPKTPLTRELLEKELIFPSIRLKNLSLVNKLFILIPDISKDTNEIIKKIFAFFNKCIIYEIEGEYYLSEFDKIKTFENGVYIKIYLPDVDFVKLFNILHDIFIFLKINKYILFPELLNADYAIQSIYNNGELDKFNPLNNLKWSKKDKKWFNEKQFKENFEPNYQILK
jgi:hypothetical protein